MFTYDTGLSSSSCGALLVLGECRRVSTGIGSLLLSVCTSIPDYMLRLQSENIESSSHGCCQAARNMLDAAMFWLETLVRPWKLKPPMRHSSQQFPQLMPQVHVLLNEGRAF